MPKHVIAPGSRASCAMRGARLKRRTEASSSGSGALLRRRGSWRGRGAPGRRGRRRCPRPGRRGCSALPRRRGGAAARRAAARSGSWTPAISIMRGAAGPSRRFQGGEASAGDHRTRARCSDDRTSAGAYETAPHSRQISKARSSRRCRMPSWLSGTGRRRSRGRVRGSGPGLIGTIRGWRGSSRCARQPGAPAPGDRDPRDGRSAAR